MTMTGFADPTVFLAATSGVPRYAFAVARDPVTKARLYHVEQRPSQEGDPDQPFVMDIPFGWMGMGSSISNRTPDTYDYGNCDARFQDRLYPGPELKSVALSLTPDQTIRSLWIARSPNSTEYVYVGGGQRFRKVGVSDDADKQGQTYSDGAWAYGPPTFYQGKWYIPRSAGLAFVRVTVADEPAGDTWEAANTSGTVQSTAFGVAVLAGSTTPVLIAGATTGQIIVNSAGTLAAADWSAPYQIAPQNEIVNGLVSIDGAIYVGTTAGLYAVDPNVNGTPLTPELVLGSSLNAGRPTVTWHGKVFYPHLNGLYRAIGGLSRTMGIETLPAFTGFRGRVTAMATFPQWLYSAVYDGTNSYIIAGRARESGETGTGEIVWHTLSGPHTGEIGAMCAYQGTDTRNPRLYFGLDTALKYYVLGKNGGFDPGDSAYRYAAAGTHYLAPTDLGRPSTLKVAEVIELSQKLQAGDSWTIGVDWDGAGTYAAALSAAGSGYQRLPFVKGSNDSGRKLKLRPVVSNTTAAAASYLDGGRILVRGRERPDQVREATLALDLRGNIHLDQGKTFLELETQLRDWKESGAALTFTDNFSGETFTCRLQEVVRDESTGQTGSFPGYTVKVRLVEALN